MFELKTKEKIFYSKDGKPESVLLDYKVYREMLELIEDNECIKIIEKSENDRNLSENEFLNKVKMN